MFQNVLDGTDGVMNPAFAAMLGYDSPEELQSRFKAEGIARALFKNPDERRRHLDKLKKDGHPNIQRKYMGAPAYRTTDLLAAYRGLLDVYRALRPRPGDVYVADALGLLKQTLARLMTSPTPRRQF